MVTELLMMLAGGALVILARGCAADWQRLRGAVEPSLQQFLVRPVAETSSELDHAQAFGAEDMAGICHDPPVARMADANGEYAGEYNLSNPTQSVLHDVPPDVSEFLVPDFRPGLDACRVVLSYPDIDFVHWRDEAGVTLAFYDGEERLTLVFRDLIVPPLSDIAVEFEHPRRGKQRYLLSDLVDADETEIPPGPGDWPNARKAGPGSEVTLRLTEFAGFDATAECVEIVIPDGTGLGPKVTVEPSEDGQDALVLINGEARAILRGAPKATSRNIRLVEVAGGAAA